MKTIQIIYKNSVHNVNVTFTKAFPSPSGVYKFDWNDKNLVKIFPFSPPVYIEYTSKELFAIPDVNNEERDFYMSLAEGILKSNED